MHVHGRVIKLWNNCPKPSGWFGGQVVDTISKCTITVEGVADGYVGEGVLVEFDAMLSDKGRYVPVDTATRCIHVLLSDKRSIQSYLMSANFPGIGKTIAETLCNAYGDTVLYEIEHHPDDVKQRCNLSDKQMRTLSYGVSNTSLDNQLLKLMPHMTQAMCVTIKAHITDGYKLSSDENYPYYLHEKLKAIKKNPYYLLQIRGLSFRQVDMLATMDFGVPLDDEIRMKFLMKQAVHDVMCKRHDVYIKLSDNDEFYGLLYHLQNNYALKEPFDEAALKQTIDICVARSALYVRSYTTDAGQLEIQLYLREMWDAQQEIRICLRESLDYTTANAGLFLSRGNALTQMLSQHSFSSNHSITLNKEQEKALHMVFCNKMSFLYGGPGRGKTFWVGALIAYWRSLVGDTVMCLGPTGRSVNKLKMDTGCDDCQTIARFLAINRGTDTFLTISDKGKKKFSYNDRVLFVIDESSMVDFVTAAQLLHTISGATIVFVGDKNQLSPVMPGPFLQQVVQADKMPSCTLITNMRTKLAVISGNADKVMDGSLAVTDMLSSEFFYHPSNDDKVTQDLVMTYYQQFLQETDYKNIMVLTPVRNAKYAVSSAVLNVKLQERLLPNTRVSVPTKQFDAFLHLYYFDDVGCAIPNMFLDKIPVHIMDRVMCTDNQANMPYLSYPGNDLSREGKKSGFGVFNGDTGSIVRFYYGDAIQGGSVLIHMDDNRFVFVPVSDFAKMFTFGYALTVHKAQGSEATHLIVVLSEQLVHSMSYFAEGSNFLTRNLLYTAVTRAKEKVVVLGSHACLQHCLMTEMTYGNCTLAEEMR